MSGEIRWCNRLTWLGDTLRCFIKRYEERTKKETSPVSLNRTETAERAAPARWLFSLKSVTITKLDKRQNWLNKSARPTSPLTASVHNGWDENNNDKKSTVSAPNRRSKSWRNNKTLKPWRRMLNKWRLKRSLGWRRYDSVVNGRHEWWLRDELSAVPQKSWRKMAESDVMWGWTVGLSSIALLE